MEASRKIKIPLKTKLGYTPTKGTLGICLRSTIGRMPGDRTSRSLDAALRSRRVSSTSKLLALCDPKPVKPILQTGQDGFGLTATPGLRSWLCGSTKEPGCFGEPPETPRTRCSLRQSLLMTRLPRSPSSTLVLRLNQETVHDFILPFLPPCGPHLTPLATRSIERSLLVLSTLGGLTGNDLSRLFYTCTNTSQAATCTCNT
jgi:hypothetical protein